MMLVLYTITIRNGFQRFVLTETPNRIDYDVKPENDLNLRPMIFYTRDECLEWYKRNNERLMTKIEERVPKSDFLIIRLQALTLNDNMMEIMDLFKWEDEENVDE